MTETYTPNSSPWFSKLFECLYLYVAIASFIYMSIGILSDVRNYEGRYLMLFLYCGAGAVILSIGFSIWWHLREKKEHINSALWHAWLRGILRYYLAYEMSIYGFAKILRTQFFPMYFRDDITVGSLSGFDLTWNYFGYSYSFAVILGLFQIGGGILLLFRRTSLLGVCILLPVMVNIVLINMFYHIAVGAFINSIIITIGLLYLLLLKWEDLISVFFNAAAVLPPVRLSLLKPFIKLLVIAVAFGTIYSYVYRRPASIFAGKWKVYQFIRNGKVISGNDWLTNPNSWCYIYIEETGNVLMSPNPYVFDRERVRQADYQYDDKTHIMKLIFAHVDTQKVMVSHYTGTAMQWNTVLDDSTLQLKLIKADKPERR
jgi:hypothetical protein